jgi:hypothetical protein
MHERPVSDAALRYATDAERQKGPLRRSLAVVNGPILPSGETQRTYGEHVPNEQ